MPSIKLKITSNVPLGGKQPGAVFSVETDESGVILDGYWRRRMRDEELHKCGAVEVVKPTAPAAPAPAEPSIPASASAPSKSKKA